MTRETSLIDVRQRALLPADERPAATWEQMINAFLNTLDSKNTRATYGRTLRRLPAELGGRGPRDVTGNDLAAWRRAIQDRVESGETAPGTARRKVATLRAFFKFAHILGQSLVGPDARAFVLKLPRGDVQTPFFTLTADDEARLLSTLDGDERGMVAVMLYAGLRVTEMCNLRVSDYYANGDGKLWIMVRRGKRGKTRQVPAGPMLAAILGDPGRGDDPLFESRQRSQDGGRHYSRVRAWQILQAALVRACPDKAGKFSPHSLRHTAAMRWLRAAVPLTVIQEWMGHASLDTTRKYLDHLHDDEKHALMM